MNKPKVVKKASLKKAEIITVMLKHGKALKNGRMVNVRKSHV
jgi:hypothetical protein